MATVIKICEVTADKSIVWSGTYIAGIQSVLLAMESHSNEYMRKQWAAILYEDERMIGIVAYARNGEVIVVEQKNVNSMGRGSDRGNPRVL